MKAPPPVVFKASGGRRDSRLIIYSSLHLCSAALSVRDPIPPQRSACVRGVSPARDVKAPHRSVDTSSDHKRMVAVVLFPWQREPP